ncbi:DUF6232 family protein [Streptomyces sp. 2RAF24]|uniref:DUF6232 family protein n=1 Tax=Streptomyces sp. 2RAF24 TaxID=3232997 RepID=UPI003F954956
MDTTGNFGPPPPRNPPPGPPPSTPPDESPSAFPPVPRGGAVLEIAVRRRMLWVGSAAFPLHNISRVEAFKLKPDRGAAFIRFLKWLAVVAAVYVAFNVMNGGDTSLADDTSPVLVIVVVVLIIVLIKELAEAPKPILAVETAGGSLALVTLPSVDQLRGIAGQIVHAIDHPEAEFTAYVHQLNNYNGPVINQNGTGNTGTIRR